MSNYPEYRSAPTRQSLVKSATQGGFALAGGVALMIFSGIIGIPVLGPIIGGALFIGGLVTRPKNSYGSKSDKFSSVALMALGGVAVATIIPGLGGLANFVLGTSAFGLIGFGIWKLIEYSRGMKRL